MKDRDLILELVKELIKNNSYREITNQTNYNTQGIYLIYIDNFSDEKYIPIYVGQTINFQKRYNQHFKELLALNRFKFKTYKEIFFSRNGFYNGYFQTNKIFKYMVEHKCTLKDYHMVIIEETNNLDEREEFYISKLYAPFFGFNQLNTRIEENKGTEITKLIEFVDSDIKNINKFFNYGFTEFNYRFAFINYDYLKAKTKGKDRYLETLNALKRLEKEHSNSQEEILSVSKNVLNTKREEFGKLYSLVYNQLELYKEKNNVKSETLITEVLDYIFSNDKSLIEKIIDYLEKNNKPIKEINDIIFQNKNNLYNKYHEILVLQQNIKANTKYLKLIFPQIEYKDFPLKDNYYPYSFKEKVSKDKKNYCIIHITFSNSGRNINSEPLTIDYLFVNNYQIIKQENVFVKSSADYFFNSKSFYTEKDFENPYSYYRKPFNLRLLGEEVRTLISTTTELESGINEYTLEGKNKVDFVEKIKEISKLIDNDTEIVYLATNYKNLILNYKDKLKDNILFEKMTKGLK